MPIVSSRQRFGHYQRSERERRQQAVSDASSASYHGGDQRARGPRQRTFWVLLKAFLVLIRKHWGTIAGALAMLTLAIGLRLIPPYGTKLAIDGVLTNPPAPVPAWLTPATGSLEPMGVLILVAAVVVVVTIIATAIGLSSRWMATKAVNQAQVTIRKHVFDHAIRLPLHRIYEMKSGGVASLIREDAGGVAELIFSLLYNPWRAMVQFIGSLVILMVVDWKLMAGGLLLLPVVWLTHRTWISRVRPLFKDIRKQRQRIDANAAETFGGIRVVRTFARGHSEARRFVGDGDFLVRQQLYTWWWTRVIELVWEVAIPLASTGLLLYGGYQILQGELTIGELMMFLVYLTMLLDPLATLAGSAVSFQNNLAGLDRILDVLQEPAELPTRPNASVVRRDQVQGRVTLENVAFAYPGSTSLVLNDISLDVLPGQTVALVGRSGAGKTTLTNLVARFYDPTAGRILLDGKDLRDIDLQSFRRSLGVVEQDVFLFEGSVRENIAYSHANATDAEIRQAASAAAADRFIADLPEGYETLIGERGVKLSGGQRQRIAIARAILADPRLLILDEATSNLDSESERLIQESLKKLLKNRTAFVIAHRLSTIRDADKIVVVEQGRIVQVGSHQELVSQPGAYQDMILLQTNTSPFAVES